MKVLKKLIGDNGGVNVVSYKFDLSFHAVSNRFTSCFIHLEH